VNSPWLHSIEEGLAILSAIQDEIATGWVRNLKGLITAEVFTDFLDMSRHLLDEKYKDPAAVMIGSVLEEHLRHLANNHGVSIEITTAKGLAPKKADSLNADLVKANVYGILEQKNITAWLDLRNKAAHGKYSEYVLSQVEIMHLGVLEFIGRVK